MRKRTGKRAGNTGCETEGQRRLQRLANLRKQAEGLPDRIGLFALGCIGMVIKPKLQSNEIKEGIQTGTKLLNETTKCLRKLGTFTPTGPETAEVIRQLKVSQQQVQRQLIWLNRIAKKGRQEK